MRIISWNIAGIRSKLKKGYLDFLTKGVYDIVCFQETKAEQEQIKNITHLTEVYPYQYWNSTLGITQKKGLSGTAIWCKYEPIREIPTPDFDLEGRITGVEYKTFNIVTVYTPNSQKRGSDRFMFRVNAWDKLFREFVHTLNNQKPTIVCGDFNVAINDIDLARNKENRNRAAGCYDEERENFIKLLGNNSNPIFYDALRMFYPDTPGLYTYWNQRNKTLRERNVGWRIDYFLTPLALNPVLIGSFVLQDIIGSDHCPITCSFQFDLEEVCCINEYSGENKDNDADNDGVNTTGLYRCVSYDNMTAELIK
jgi:exodeoxyribonuclease III